MESNCDSSPEHRKCPFCESLARRRTSSAPAYWQCESCRAAFLWPLPSEAELARFYEAYHRPADAGGAFAKFEERTAADFKTKCSLIRRWIDARSAGPRPRLLDVGCGKGLFVAEALRCGFDAHGIDISETAVDAGRRGGVPTLRAGAIAAQRDWARSFDVVTAWATIEHVRDPRAFLDQVVNVLVPGGLFFVDTGLAGDLVDETLPGTTQWYEPAEHMYVFSVRALTRMLRDAGFDVFLVDPLFERSTARRLAKIVRNASFSLAAGALFRLVLGRSGWEQARATAKLPIGSLLLVGARLR